MRKSFMGLSAVALATVAVGASAPIASAYVRIGTKCILRVTTPYFVNAGAASIVDGQGETDCTSWPNNPPYYISNQACIWVLNGSTWYQINSSCYVSATRANEGFNIDDIYAYPSNGGYAQGHTYSTWTRGEEQDVYQGVTNANTYQSSNFTCGCP